ncbi:hypothetical protein ACSMX9_20935 [Streptomyces sp. LE64]|uniref:hypothetical protein n=1 Tax=Streptomyces sp. LE64 TaxID=3448653 RepID=UPI0040437162
MLRAGQRYPFATEYDPDHRFHTVIPVHGDRLVPEGEAPAPGVADVNGDGRSTTSERWEIAVRDQTDPSAAPTEPDPTREPFPAPS